MRRLIVLFFLFAVASLKAQLTDLTEGRKIHSSVKVIPKTYYFNTGVDSIPVIEISGNNLVVDFNHAELNGNEKGLNPDQFKGIAIKITGGKNITIKNLVARGYKVALLARNTEELTIENCDFSYNYRQHLNSTQQKEDLSDWMSYHHNENDEWLRYGAGIYLKECNHAIIHDNIITNGQCALMMTKCNSGLIFNNNFSFNSGIGIGLYRSSANQVAFNRLDFNVRGFSNGVYYRGQDSAGILVFEQCNDNLFFRNSVTHSGDGFFLWAGQYTMDTGEGGCNDNILAQNDFSYAPTNGVELTFSRNQVLGNLIKGCDNGLWGGYSFHSKINGNRFEANNTAIAIEHGQYNEVYNNNFSANKTGIKLWARKQQPADWIYAAKKDTRSRGYKIANNLFNECGTAINLSVSDSLYFNANQFKDCGKNFIIGETVTGIDSATNANNQLMKPDTGFSFFMDSRIKPNLSGTANKYSDRSDIRITEWGPYDFRSPLIWNTNPTSKSDTMQFEIIGPKGNWKLVNHRGVKNISLQHGTIPSYITAIKTHEKGQDIFIELEYAGKEIITPFGKKIHKDKPWHFNYRNALLPVDWTVKWYAFDSSDNPVRFPEKMGSLTHKATIQEENTNELNYAWWGGIGKEKKVAQFFTLAEADVELPKGNYFFSVSWDDAVRLYVDGRLVLDEWNPSRYVFDESPNKNIKVSLGGRHHIRVEHVELGGFATLIVKLKKE